MLAVALTACGGDSGGEETVAGQPGGGAATAERGIPDLVGATIEEAQAMLVAANPAFDLKIAYARSAEPEGTVIAQSPGAGSPLEFSGRLYEVEITVSDPNVTSAGATDLCHEFDVEVPAELDCDPASGKFIGEGKKCEGRGQLGTLGHLVCARSQFCSFDQWAKRGTGPSTSPCKPFRTDHPNVLAPGAECTPGQPLPYPYVCRER